MDKKIGIIIPMFNLWHEMTKPCLLSLAKHTDISQIHVYLIDNASDILNDTYEKDILYFGSSLFPHSFTYQRLDKNYGFAYACNFGAKLAQNNNLEYLFFLNNDTLLSPNWLTPLKNSLQDKKVGAVSPLLLFPQNQRVQHVGVSLNPVGGMRHIYYNFPANHELVQKKRYLHYISGAAFFIKTSAFFEAGLFCEAYINGVEDIDLCCTLTKMGYLLTVEPKSLIYHYGSQSIGRSNANAQNFNLFISRHEHLVYDDPIIAHKDGYSPCLTKEFQYYLRISDEKNAQYKKAFEKTFTPTICLKILEKEPYFMPAYEYLANYYIQENHIEKACFYRELAVNFCPTKENYEKLILSYELLEQNTHIAGQTIYKENERKKHYKTQLSNILTKSTDKEYQENIEKHFLKLSKSNPIYAKIYATRSLY